MIPDTSIPWFEANQRYLTLSLARVRHTLFQSQAGQQTAPVETDDLEALKALAATMSAPPAVETLCALFGLSPFERDVLLLCAGVELDTQFLAWMAPQTAPTFSLALAVFPDAHWSALTPSAPLRRWRLIETVSASSLTQSPLRIDETILHYLAGMGCQDERLAGYIDLLPSAEEVPPARQAGTAQMASAWANGANTGRPLPILQLCGGDVSTRQQAAAAICAGLGLGLGRLNLQSVPNNPVEVEALMRLWKRQSMLGSQALLLRCDEAEPARSLGWLEATRFPLILSTRERIPVHLRQVLTYDIQKPSAVEQTDLWRQALGPEAARLNGRLETLSAHFDLDEASIHAITTRVLQTRPASVQDLGEALWQACRTQAHPLLGELAQRIQPLAKWEDLVLPAAQIQTLREVAIHVRQRLKVYQTWGFASKSARGLGISALFTGLSGTGKTMAAEVLANELQLDLYRIDLSQVVSKYIGETEKNLRRVFDAAEEGGAILLFDEADALFGKRSEVKDSHDRYANVEVSYLLQRMEAYRGLAILTTNLKEAIDTAFLRRIRFVVQFPFPDAAQRAEIWRRIFPSRTPVEGLELERLARLSVAGGSIRNIALQAAFLAAEAHEPVRMSHLLRAARSEYAKLEKPLSEAEIGGWA
jgi:hypothetical protein